MARLSSREKLKGEEEIDKSLRPEFLEEYIGQENLKNNLKVFMGAAKSREEVLDHVLLYGPPGLGKTTLAHIIAKEMNGDIKTISGPSIEKPGDLVGVLTTLDPGDVLFIDEIHRIPRVVEELLYSAMEDFRINIIVSKETTAENITIQLPPFTLVGATTRAGDLSAPLRSRFGIMERVLYYSNEELALIVKRTSKFFKCEIDDASALEVAKRSRGTPRITNRIFRRVRDFANYNQSNVITLDDTTKALNALRIDSIGLDDVDINYLLTLKNRFNGGPAGVETLACATGEEVVQLEEVYEPYLVKIGFIDRTPKGRILTTKGRNHLRGIKELFTL